MTQPRPTAAELLDAVRSFLVEDLLPDLEGRRRFHARVAANVLEMVERELAGGAAADRAEGEGLRALLAADRGMTDETDPETEPGADDDGPDGADRIGSSRPPHGDRPVDDLARDLADRIRRGEVDIDDPRLVEHLRRTAAADVAIANPRWLEEPLDGPADSPSARR